VGGDGGSDTCTTQQNPTDLMISSCCWHSAPWIVTKPGWLATDTFSTIGAFRHGSAQNVPPMAPAQILQQGVVIAFDGESSKNVEEKWAL
jgi:hypothetical protein